MPKLPGGKYRLDIILKPEEKREIDAIMTQDNYRSYNELFRALIRIYKERRKTSSSNVSV